VQVHLEQVQPSERGHLRLIPNINRSGRPLAATFSSEELRAGPRTDREAPTRRLSDRELYSLIVDVSAGELAARPALALEIHFANGLFRVLNKSGIPRAGERPPVVVSLLDEHKASTKGRGIQLFLEAQTFFGSPLLPQDATPSVVFRFVDGDDLVLEQSSFGGNDVRTADVILVGDDAAPQRIYICDVVENQPSVRDVAAAARQAKVELAVVPLAVNLGDSWLQDQFQLGYTATREGAQNVILHLPRMVNDSALIPGTPNLRNFVDAHFPSDGVGVVRDFWEQQTTASDGMNSVKLGVAESYGPFKELVRAIRLLRAMHSLIRKLDRNANPDVPGGDVTNLYLVRLALDDAYARLLAYRRADEDARTLITAMGTALKDVSATLDRDRTSVKLTLKRAEGEQTLVFTADTQEPLQRFFTELRDLHSSRNYGGNIEVSPPFADAVYGKILAGSITSPSLKAFLTSRGSRHPLVSVYTDWLDVGHIDEIACFVNRGGGFALLRAAPLLAVSMLERALVYQGQGKLVTRLFRGKKWLHQGRANSVDAHTPPSAYAALLARTGPYDLSGLATKVDRSHKDPYGHSSFHDDRQFLVFSRRATTDVRYAAFISCADLLSTCRETNRTIDALFLASDYRYADEVAYSRYVDSTPYREKVLPFRLDAVLAKEFPGVPVLPVPMLFDRVDDVMNAGTKAIVPGIVNLQTLGNTVLVPRPYGPRLRPGDAISLVCEFLAKFGGTNTKPDRDYARSRGLDQTFHWTRPAETVHHAHLGGWPTEFDVAYDEMSRAEALAAAVSTTTFEVMSLFRILHGNDPLSNHPVAERENLLRIAGYFKDGFDEFKNIRVDFCAGDTAQSHPLQDRYEADIKKVMERIKIANPGVFDNAGELIVRDWVKLTIPEETVDIFELYTQVVLESLGMSVQWVDSWYYHTHSGGIHCGTNVLRSRT
jgi:hypothetical protein